MQQWIFVRAKLNFAFKLVANIIREYLQKKPILINSLLMIKLNILAIAILSCATVSGYTLIDYVVFPKYFCIA